MENFNKMPEMQDRIEKMSLLEVQVKDLLRESFNKRLVGHGNIDNIFSNSELVEQWLTRVMALAHHKCKIEPAAQFILNCSFLMPDCSIETIRAELLATSERFSDEIFAFLKYIELSTTQPEDVVLAEVKEELQDVEEGNIFYF